MNELIKDEPAFDRYIREYKFTRISPSMNIIYLVIIGLVISFLIVMATVKFSVTIQADGVIRPINDKSFVKTLQSGQVTSVYKKEGEKVKAGDAIIDLSTENLTIREVAIRNVLQQKQTYIADLTKLCNSEDFKGISSELYQKEAISYDRKLDELQSKMEKAKKELQRNEILFKNGIISEKDYDDLKFQFTQTENEYNAFKSAQLAEWQNALASYRTEVEQSEGELRGILKDKELCQIKAPVSGTIEELKNIFSGINIESGQVIAVISPDTGLIAEIFVTPRDIGYIKKNDDVRIQVDAFNYLEWGMITGKVTDISDDYLLVDNTLCFRIRCTMSKDYLSLRNGIKGRLKKGMTIRARFKVAEKTILQMIYENTNTWLNPTQK